MHPLLKVTVVCVSRRRLPRHFSKMAAYITLCFSDPGNDARCHGTILPQPVAQYQNIWHNELFYFLRIRDKENTSFVLSFVRCWRSLSVRQVIGSLVLDNAFVAQIFAKMTKMIFPKLLCFIYFYITSSMYSQTR